MGSDQILLDIHSRLGTLEGCVAATAESQSRELDALRVEVRDVSEKLGRGRGPGSATRRRSVNEAAQGCRSWDGW